MREEELPFEIRAIIESVLKSIRDHINLTVEQHATIDRNMREIAVASYQIGIFLAVSEHEQVEKHIQSAKVFLKDTLEALGQAQRRLSCATDKLQGDD